MPMVWVEPEEISVPDELSRVVGGHTLVAQTLVRRGHVTIEAAQAFLDPERYRPSPASELPDVEAAVERIWEAVERGERICVWGDFDVDGQTATTTLVSTLRALGGDVIYHIPNRESESHGINPLGLERVIGEGARLILTCDTGVSEHRAIEYARSQGVDVVVTDHHDLPGTLPPAYGVVNPKRLPVYHPLRELPGVGVAYKLAEALYEHAGQPGAAEGQLDLVALGIVADLALQRRDVRYLLQRGLAALRRTSRLGLRSMMNLATLNPESLTEEHIAFILAPRLNALGRLADANLAVLFLTTEDEGQARILASELEGLNGQRKLLCDQVIAAAQAQIERNPGMKDEPVLVLAHPAWPPGVIGIVASRLVERYHRPTILIATPEGVPGRGSARSIEGVDISSAIADQRDLLLEFGGHPMAAGLSIEADRIPEFRRRLIRAVEATVGEAELRPHLHLDAYVELSDLTLELVEDLERLAPFGPGNPGLTLASRRLRLISQRPVGRDGDHLLIVVEDEAGTARKVIWWQGVGWPAPEGLFDLAYVVRATSYQGQREVQVEWVDSRLIEEEAPTVSSKPRAPVVVDHRQAADPLAELRRLRGEGEIEVWGEGEMAEGVGARGLKALTSSPELAIWTLPPGPEEFREALERVVPETVYLFAVEPGERGMAAFLKRLAGVVKYAIRSQGGRVRIAALSSATAQREPTVRKALEWLEGRGHVRMVEDLGEEIRLVESGSETDDTGEIELELKALLVETETYRAYYRQAAPEKLLGGEIR